MFPKMDPKAMAKIMSQMGMKTEEIDASRVIVEKADGSQLIVSEPKVSIITMQGQQSLQVSGRMETVDSVQVSQDLRRGGDLISPGDAAKDDADIVMEQTGVSRAEAEKALADNNGDLAGAILQLKAR